MDGRYVEPPPEVGHAEHLERRARLAEDRLAEVLGLADHVGTLSEGRAADLICVSVDGPHSAPMYDPFSHMVFAARASDVRHVMVRGEVVVRNRELKTLDVERIEAQVREFSETMRPS